MKVLQALPQTGDRAAVADGDGDEVRHLPVELLGDLIGDGLLALGEVGVDGCIAVVPAPAVNGLLRQLKRVLIAALHGDDGRAERHELGDLALRRAGRDENKRLEPGGRSVAREGRGSVARGRAGDDMRACLLRLGDGHGGGAVLQRGCGVLAVVLDPELRDAELLCKAVGLIQRRPADAQRGRGRLRLDGQQLTIAPHGALRAVLQRLAGQDGLDLVIVINDIEDAAAFAVRQIRNGGIFPAAAHAAAAFYMVHRFGSFLRAFRSCFSRARFIRARRRSSRRRCRGYHS